MLFSQIPNAAISKEADRPLMQKEVYPVSDALQQYLRQHKKDTPLPISYTELLHYEYTNALKDDKGKHTHWERVVYEKEKLSELQKKLVLLYEQLKNETEIQVDSIDFCEFANTMPFRVNITHTKNNSKDLFYIKSADASRIYGLLLEQLLTDNPVNFLYHRNTLVEEHIDGMPGDDFLKILHTLNQEDQKRLAEAFVGFNESCFARLLGDMRSYNFVVLQNKTVQQPFTIKAIDFDQQCYEGRINLYLPQFYKENYRYVQLVTELFADGTIQDLQERERAHLTGLVAKNRQALSGLLSVMSREEISENYKVVSLRKELNRHHHTQVFSHCGTMGALVKQQLVQLLTPLLPAGSQLFATI